MFSSERSTVQTEILGVKVVGASFAMLGWFMREQPVPDQGIDAQVAFQRRWPISDHRRT
jgi:hypothetical protein